MKRFTLTGHEKKRIMMIEKRLKTVEVDENIRWKRCNVISRNISERGKDDFVIKRRKMNKTNLSKEGVF